MLFELPFSTFDQARARDLVARLYCSSCRRTVEINIEDERLRGKSFCSGVRFRCANIVKRWSASPGHVCNQHASITLRPRVPLDLRAGIPHIYIACPSCRPGWHLHQIRGDDPEWHPILTRRGFSGLRCPTCRGKASVHWANMTGRDCMDTLRAAGPAIATGSTTQTNGASRLSVAYCSNLNLVCAGTSAL